MVMFQSFVVVVVQDDKPVEWTEPKNVMNADALDKKHVKVAKQNVKSAEQLCVTHEEQGVKKVATSVTRHV
jgi:hypothetical protein